MTDKKAMKLALEALQRIESWVGLCGVELDAVKALEEALAKQEQGEPVAHTAVFNCPNCKYPHRVFTHITGAAQFPWEVTTPQQRKPPTDEQCDNLAAEIMDAVAKEKGLDNAMHLNCDIATQTTLRRAIVRAAYGIKE